MPYSTFFIDLDATLYAPDNGLWQDIGKQIVEFMHAQMGLPLETVHTLKQKYYEEYGTTLRGLQLHHGIQPEDYLSFVHNLPLQTYMGPDLELKKILKSLPQPKWVFTNSDQAHALRVLNTLALQDCFAGIIGLETLGYIGKPYPSAFKKALKVAGEQSAVECVFLDDSPRNLAPAREMGFFTILVGPDGTGASADLCIPRIHDLPEAMPELWKPD